MASSVRANRAAPKRSIRALAGVICSAVVAMSACSDPPLDDRAVPPEHVFADSLVISVEDIRHIANFEGLQPYSYADRHHPLASINAPGPCQAVGSSNITFTSGWREYRAVTYSGTTDDLRPGGIAPINEVSHAVAVYPNSGAARGALAQLESRLAQCASLHDNAYDFALSKPDPMTLRLRSAGWSHLYRAKSSVLMSVGVLGIEPTEQVATTVLQTITDRIK
jgi:PknH-like extracellular domain